MCSMAIGTYMNTICEAFNTQAIPRLIELNKGHFKGITAYPQMVHGDVEKGDVEKFANMVSSLVGAGVLTPNEELSREVCRRVGLPEEVAAESVPDPAQQNAPAGSGKGEDKAVEQMKKAWKAGEV